MRILTVISELGVGGAEVVATTLATAMAEDGHESVLASTPGFRVDQLARSGVVHVPLQLAGRDPRGLLRSLARLRRLAAPDLVHAHNPKPAVLARLAFGHRAPIVATLHGVKEKDVRSAARLLRWSSDRVVVVSPHLAGSLTRRGYPADRVSIITNRIDPPAHYPRAQARRELGVAPDATVGLCLARMVDQKRHDLLIRAWAATSAPAPAVLLLAGDGPNRADVIGAIRHRGLGAAVRVLGDRTDVPRLLAASDFLVLPTDWEGLPLSILEAMSVGLPVVASAVPGVVEHVGAGVRLVPPGSAGALASALDEMLTQPSVRIALGDRGRALAADRFRSEPMIARYRDIYESAAVAVTSRPYGPHRRLMREGMR